MVLYTSELPAEIPSIERDKHGGIYIKASNSSPSSLVVRFTHVFRTKP